MGGRHSESTIASSNDGTTALLSVAVFLAKLVGFVENTLKVCELSGGRSILLINHTVQLTIYQNRPKYAVWCCCHFVAFHSE